MKKIRVLAAALAFSVAFGGIATVTADEIDDMRNQQAASQAELEQVNQNIDALEADKNVLMGQIDSVGQELVLTIVQVETLASEIEAKNAELEVTAANLAAAEEDKAVQYEAMKKRIQYLYENGGTDSWAQILLESNSIADMLSKIENNGKMYDYDRDALEQLREVVQQVQDLEDQLMTEKAELEDSKKEQEDKQDTLETKMSQLKASAADYDKQIATVKAQAQEYKNLIEQQNAELQQIQKEEEAAAKAEEARQRAAEAAAQTNTSSGTTTGTTGGSSSSNTSSGSTSDTSSNVSYDSATGEAVVAYARQFIGNPYVYGGNSLTNGIDCSGFTQQIFAHFGYSLPRTSDAQAFSGVGVSWENHRAGDIIVYSGHVAILTGDGGIIHASNSAPYPQGGIKYTANALYRSYIAIRRIVQ